jgi:hypothetical protein
MIIKSCYTRQTYGPRADWTQSHQTSRRLYNHSQPNSLIFKKIDLFNLGLVFLSLEIKLN